MNKYISAVCAAALCSVVASAVMASAPTPVPVHNADFSAYNFQLGT